MKQVTGESVRAEASTAAVQSASHAPESFAPLPEPSRAHLPEEPLVVIEPSSGWVPVRFRDLWTYRELLYFLMWRDIKVRYKQAALGLAWVIMQPLFTAFIFTVFMGWLGRFTSDEVPYPLFVYAGLLVWTFFSNAVLNGGNSIVGNANLITKVYFPRAIIPAAAIGARLVDLGVAFVILIGLMLYYGVGVSWHTLMVVPLLLLVTLFSFGLGLLLSALNVKYRDVGLAVPVIIQLWMFVSPVIYSTRIVPPKWETLYKLNPLVGMLEGFRAALFNLRFDWTALAVSAVSTVALLVYSAYVFRRVERSFADLA